jgi:signal transduction histidine kinase
VAYHNATREAVESINQHFLSRDGDSSTKLHLERTLDEAYYPGLSRESLKERNKDQVVTRRYLSKDSGIDIPILTVAQLWLWRADNVVVSAYASRPLFDETGAGYQSDLYKMNPEISGVDKRTLSPDLLMGQLIANRIKAFGSPNNEGVKFPPVLNIFESAMVSALSDVDSYVRSANAMRLDTTREEEFIHHISDIRSELAMIQDILNQQKEVLSKLLNDKKGPKSRPDALELRGEDWGEVREVLSTIGSYHKRAEKIDRDAERIEQVIQNKLGVKRTAASQEQALASIQEAKDSKRLSLLVIGFTVMTIIFTPLSFLATLFAADIDILSSLKYTPGSQSAQTSNSANNKPEDVYHGGTMAGIFRESNSTFSLCNFC